MLDPTEKTFQNRQIISATKAMEVLNCDEVELKQLLTRFKIVLLDTCGDFYWTPKPGNPRYRGIGSLLPGNPVERLRSSDTERRAAEKAAIMNLSSDQLREMAFLARQIGQLKRKLEGVKLPAEQENPKKRPVQEAKEKVRQIAKELLQRPAHNLGSYRDLFDHPEMRIIIREHDVSYRSLKDYTKKLVPDSWKKPGAPQKT